MPYIDKANREGLENALTSIACRIIATDEADQACMLNYCISTLLSKSLAAQGTKYRKINELVGVLECAKLELYRRIASPYEDVKMESNGDVY